MRLINLIRQYDADIDSVVAGLLVDDMPLDISIIARHIYDVQRKIMDIGDDVKRSNILTALLYVQRTLCGAEISPTTVIGENLMLVHQGGIVIGGGVIGDNVKIHSGVIIGDKNNDTICPTIGNDVTIYANSVVYGNITIGDGAIIAPCSVVSKSVRQGEFVYGYI